MFHVFFIHGWGFCCNFWKPLVDILKKNQKIKSLSCIDLGFFSQKNNNFSLDENNKNIFIVHSYGLNWFLKQKIKCFALINFFAAPSFLEYQQNPKKRRILLKKMIKKVDIEPEKVIKDFHILSGLKKEYSYDNFYTNLQSLKVSLNELLLEDLTKEFKKKKNKIFSFYSSVDKIFVPSPKKITYLKQTNHSIKYIHNHEHSSPFTRPNEISHLIDETMENLIDF